MILGAVAENADGRKGGRCIHRRIAALHGTEGVGCGTLPGFELGKIQVPLNAMTNRAGEEFADELDVGGHEEVGRGSGLAAPGSACGTRGSGLAARGIQRG
jgi:hypothetical protein